MTKLIAGMTTSLDGFVAGTGLRLFPDGGPTPPVALEGVRQVGDRTCLRYRVG